MRRLVLALCLIVGSLPAYAQTVQPAPAQGIDLWRWAAIGTGVVVGAWAGSYLATWWLGHGAMAAAAEGGAGMAARGAAMGGGGAGAGGMGAAAGAAEGGMARAAWHYVPGAFHGAWTATRALFTGTGAVIGGFAGDALYGD